MDCHRITSKFLPTDLETLFHDQFQCSDARVAVNFLFFLSPPMFKVLSAPQYAKQQSHADKYLSFCNQHIGRQDSFWGRRYRLLGHKFYIELFSNYFLPVFSRINDIYSLYDVFYFLPTHIVKN